jgi:hypothetical protein
MRRKRHSQKPSGIWGGCSGCNHDFRDKDHCLRFRCVSVWWYYDQIVRDTPGFIHNLKRARGPIFQPQGNKTINRHQTPNSTSTWSPMQLNIADEAERQRQLMINRTAPESHEDMVDIEEWDTFYDDKMRQDQKRIIVDLLYEVNRISHQRRLRFNHQILSRHPHENH